MSDVTFHMDDGRMEVHRQHAEPWKVTLIDTGELTNTGGRLRRVADNLINETFCFTYGDGLADVDLGALVAYHQSQKLEATVTAVQPPGRYGSLDLSPGQACVRGFIEKPHGDGGWINAGFFVLEPSVLKRISGDDASWENDVLRSLADDGQLGAYRHDGFWQAMDTLRERNLLEQMWSEGRAPWKQWA
jgi:glucose-1-phosphate cytidylyltransferase